jgi:DNA replication protein DnaC
MSSVTNVTSLTPQTDIRLSLLLRQLHLPVVLANYQKLAIEASRDGQRYEEYLLALLDMEVNQRDVNRRKRLISEAHFPVKHTLDEFDFAALPSLNRAKVIQLAGGEYIKRHENIALIGSIGTGKTHIGTSLGMAACQQGYKVRFYTVAGLVNELLEAGESHRLSKLESYLMKYHLIILDELGFVPFSQKGAQMLFTFISQRYQRGSMIVTSNLAFAEWTEVFGDPRLTSALLDRMTHHCHILEFSGRSHRFRQSMQSMQRQEAGVLTGASVASDVLAETDVSSTAATSS